jgi:MFS family permease
MVLGAPLSMKIAEHVGVKAAVTGGLTVVAGALLLMSDTSEGSGYAHVALVLALLGFGMGATMAPATSAVMAALPNEKAGVGSAINDTVRQVGGALGVAVLGSLVSSTFGSRIDALTHGQRIPSGVRDGIGPALAVAARLPGPAGQSLADAARQAFVHGMDVTMMVGSGFVLIAVVVAAVWMPRHVESGARAVDYADAGDRPYTAIADLVDA